MATVRVLNGDIAEKITELKKQQGPDLHVWGSGNLLQTLIKHDHLFGDGTIPAAFKLTENIVGSTGVIVASYERAGAGATGSQ